MFPNLSNPTTFPTFHTLTLATSSSLPTPTIRPKTSFLLATIQQNMTLGSDPTFICKDAAGTSFAVMIKLGAPLTPSQLEGSRVDENGRRLMDGKGLGSGAMGKEKGKEEKGKGDAGREFEIGLCRKGWTVVVREAERSGVKDGKQGHVRVRWEDLRVSFSRGL